MGELLPLSVLKTLWSHGDQHVPGLIEGIAASAPAVFEKYGVTTTLEVAHIMAQFSEECGAGLEMVENLNYSAEGLRRTFPTHFTESMAEHYAHNPRMIADVAYGGRMGNAPPPSDDGWNYRGKGLSQLTGKANYTRLAVVTGLDVIHDPDILIRPATALECAVADFVRICGCLPLARRDDVHGVTLHLNGGYNGLAERIRWLREWKVALKPFWQTAPAAKPQAYTQSSTGTPVPLSGATDPPPETAGQGVSWVGPPPPPPNPSPIMTALANLKAEVEKIV
jgi:putative chitinase